MEIVSIEKKTFEAMAARLESFAALAESLCRRYNGSRMGVWLDNEDVCRILHLTPRALQTLRENGSLPFTQTGRKVWYRPEDVKNLLAEAGIQI